LTESKAKKREKRNLSSPPTSNRLRLGGDKFSQNRKSKEHSKEKLITVLW